MSNYPYPAFLLPAKPEKGRFGQSLAPLFANERFHRVFSGVDFASETQSASDWASALGSAENAKVFSYWLADLEYASYASAASNDSGSQTQSSSDISVNQERTPLELQFSPSWAPDGFGVIKLQLVKTLCNDRTWAITTVPLTPLPPVPPPQVTSGLGVSGSGKPRSSSPPSSIQRPASANMRIPDFPLPHTIPLQQNGPSTSSTIKEDPNYLFRIPSVDSSPKVARLKLSSTASGSGDILASPEPRVLELSPKYEEEEEVVKLLDEFPWETTSLGPRGAWSTSLVTAGE